MRHHFLPLKMSIINSERKSSHKSREADIISLIWEMKKWKSERARDLLEVTQHLKSRMKIQTQGFGPHG